MELFCEVSGCGWCMLCIVGVLEGEGGECCIVVVMLDVIELVEVWLEFECMLECLVLVMYGGGIGVWELDL